MILAIAILTLAGAATIGFRSVYATDSQGKYPSIIQKLVERFGLNETDVQTVFDEVKQEKQSLMQERFEERLNQAVGDGKLTEAQKQLVLDKHQEMVVNRQENKEDWHDMTFEQIRIYKQEYKEDLENWATQNDIDLQYLFGGFNGHFKGMKGYWHFK